MIERYSCENKLNIREIYCWAWAKLENAISLSFTIMSIILFNENVLFNGCEWNDLFKAALGKPVNQKVKMRTWTANLVFLVWTSGRGLSIKVIIMGDTRLLDPW